MLTMLLFHLGIGLASGAFLALSMFFTLSGYLIGGQLVTEHSAQGRIDLAGFWERRIRRLMPASTLALAGAALYTATLARPDEVAGFAGDIMAAVFYVPNWRFVATGVSYTAIFFSPSPVQHFWSLGVEEQFYLGLPLIVVAALWRGSVRRLVLVTGGLVVASTIAMVMLRTPNTPLGHAYYGTDARAAEMLIGVLFALWARNTKLFEGRRADRVVNGLGVVALVASFVLWYTTSETQLWFYRGGALAYSLATSVVILACIRRGPVTRFLSFPALTYAGRISYGLYVYHWPLYVAVDALDLGLSTLPLVIVKLVGTFFVAALSHRYIETPIRGKRSFMGPRRWIAPLAAIAGLAVFSGLLLVPQADEDSSVDVTLELPSPAHDSGIALLGSGTAKGNDGAPRVLIIGNSLADRIGRGLMRWGRATGRATFELKSFTACGLLTKGERLLAAEQIESFQAHCADFHAELPGWPRSKRPDIVVFLFGGDDLVKRRAPGWSEFRGPGDPVFDEWLIDRYGEVTDDFTSEGAHVVWLTSPCTKQADSPHEKVDGALKRLRGWGLFDATALRYFNQDLLRLQRSRSPAVSLVDLHGHVCPDGSFVSSLGSIEDARPDGVHFDVRAGRLLAEWLGPEILAAASEMSIPADQNSKTSERDPGVTGGGRAD